jgi:protein phosphatase
VTVVDATNVQPEARKSLLALAKEFHLFAEAIVFDLSERVCQDRNVLRPDRQFGPHVIRNQSQQLRRSLRGLEREGLRHVFKLSSPEEVDAVTIERHPLWNNKKAEHGPFDIIGDVHGCFDELVELLAQLGYTVNQTDDVYSVSSSGERKLVFVGDLVDRGPGTVQVLRLVSSMVQSGQAFCVPGNHDMKLVRALRGRDVKRTHGLAETMEQLGVESNEFRVEVAKFLDGLVSHYVFDDGKLVIAHAGLKESMHGRGSGAVREFALFGETTGETDEFGLPVRYNWAADYRGKALVVYGHTPVPEPLFLNNTVNIDTGCVFGGQLTALRYPEREIVSVKAHQTYYEPARPFLPETTETQRPLQHAQDDVLDLADVVGKRLIDTRLKPKITIREENAIAALEVMSRFASDPKWLIYLPPTMSPTETSKHENLLEHPDEAFAFYRKEGIATVVCEQKHMGSRAVVVLCKDEILFATPFKVVDLQDEANTSDAVAWWTEMTAQGREGMVVKPLNFIAEGKRGITQPAMKCRGAEYLRIIYGPEYLLPENLERLRSRNVGAKRSLASREFALGIEALERFVRKEPLRLTHECVFGVLALESEPIDPRL